MKHLIFILSVLIITLASCDPKHEIPEIGKLDPNAMILIKPAKGVQLRAAVPGLTALEIVEQALNIKWQSHYFNDVYHKEAKSIARTFLESQKDYEAPALKMLGIDVITQDGIYHRDFTHAFNIVITDGNNDTIAYIPDNTVSEARSLIEDAYNDQDYTEVYSLFDSAFTFTPL